MSILISRLVVPTLAILSACIPAAVKQSGPAPANALTCARESLQTLGFSSMDVAKDGDSFYARRTVDSAWVHRIEHLVNVSTRTEGRPMLHVRGERVHNKEGWPGFPGVAMREPESYRMRIEPDDLLKSEIAQVIRECSGPAQYGVAAARQRAQKKVALPRRGPHQFETPPDVSSHHPTGKRMRFLRLLALPALLLAFATPAAAQLLRGRVLDAANGQPVSQARINMLNSDGRLVGRTTDAANRTFSLQLRVTDPVRLRAERTGYSPTLTQPVQVALLETVEVDVRMAVQALLVEPLTVVGRTQPQRCPYA